jgi:lysophospholipase L1-like esterase
MRRSLLIVFTALLALPGAHAATLANCSQTSEPMTPLSDLGTKRYHGYMGGLYANGKNTPTAAYRKKGLAAAKRVHPIDGRIVLLSIGMSNTTQEFSAFKRLADADPRKAGDVTIVDGAQGGQDAEIVKDPSARFWSVVEQRLQLAGVTDAQVQAVWLKEAIAQENEPFPTDATQLENDLRAIVSILRQRFPNLRLVYLSSRTYAGYATTTLNPEPYAYESGFAVKWLVLQRSAGKIGRPWLGWGPYLWTNGERGRKDGFTWTCDDVRPNDGTHPSASGQQKVATLLWNFFTTNSTAKDWFVVR